MWKLRVGSLFGVPVRLDATLLVVLPVFAYVIGAQVERTAELLDGAFGAELAVDALTAGATPWLLGSAAAVGLFVGVLAHEFGHSLVAMRYGYEIESITLWIFGGVAQLTDLPEDWRRELAIAVAGPAVSVAVGALCGGLALLAPTGAHGVRYVLLYLAVLNVALAAFNVLPAFPMDGGRILRALLGRSRSFARATEIAAGVGKGVALLLALFGLVRLDPITLGIGLFVYVAATSEAKQVVTRAALEGVTVADVMTPAGQLDVVWPQTTVQQLLQRAITERATVFPVVEHGVPAGVVTLPDAREVADVERAALTVTDVMSGDPVTIEPDEPATEALSRMQDHDVGRLLVTDGESLVGLVSRTDLTRALDAIRDGTDPAAARIDGRSPPDSTGQRPQR